MATGKMYDCEEKRPFQRNGTRVLEWKNSRVVQIPDGAEIRCLHCHGRVRIHRKRVDQGPQDHVEHQSGDDARHCRGGAEFRGGDADHRMSSAPVT